MHDLLQCLDGIKYFGETRLEPVFQAVLEKWPQIMEVVETLEIPYITTKAVQDRNFILSDFYGCWLKMLISLEHQINSQEHTTGLGQALHATLSKRKNQLLDHPAMICAIYLDPRFHYDLNETEKNFARMNLKKMWCRIAEFQNREANQNSTNDATEEDPLEKYFADRDHPMLDDKTNKISSDEPDFRLSVDEFMNLVEKYELQLPRLHHTKSVLNYWLDKTGDSYHIKDLHELQFVAATILTIPSTQTACERNFSDLNFVYGCRRTKLDRKLLQSILFIRTNRILFEEVKKNDLAAV